MIQIYKIALFSLLFGLADVGHSQVLDPFEGISDPFWNQFRSLREMRERIRDPNYGDSLDACLGGPPLVKLVRAATGAAIHRTEGGIDPGISGSSICICGRRRIADSHLLPAEETGEIRNLLLDYENFSDAPLCPAEPGIAIEFFDHNSSVTVNVCFKVCGVFVADTALRSDSVTGPTHIMSPRFLTKVFELALNYYPEDGAIQLLSKKYGLPVTHQDPRAMPTEQGGSQRDLTGSRDR